MKFEMEPGGICPAGAEALYLLADCQPQQKIEVMVKDIATGRTEGGKLLYGSESYRFNISGYTQGLLAVNPVTQYGSPRIAQAVGRTVNMVVQAGQLQGGPVMFVSGSTLAEPMARMSTAPAVRWIAADGGDEISVMVDRSCTLSARFTLYTQQADRSFLSPLCPVERGVAVLSFGLGEVMAMADPEGAGIAEGITELKVAMMEGDAELFEQRYMIRPASADAIAVAWLNDMGGVDTYSFIPAAGQTDASKGSVLRSVTLFSEYESRACVDWLAGILSSPQVWIVGPEGATQVQVIEGGTVLAEEKPSRLKITVGIGKK